jgi:hypothetical protein
LLDDTVHDSRRAFERGGAEALKTFDHEGSSRLGCEQAIALGDWIDAHHPRTTPKIGAWLRRSCALSHSRFGLIALLHHLGFAHCEPEAVPRVLDPPKQQAFAYGIRWAWIRPSCSSPSSCDTKHPDVGSAFETESRTISAVIHGADFRGV